MVSGDFGSGLFGWAWGSFMCAMGGGGRTYMYIPRGERKEGGGGRGGEIALLYD